jgi:hypothetical protein
MYLKNIFKSGLLLYFLFTLNFVLAQEETSSLKFGYNVIENKPTIDFQFNRTSSSKAKDKYEITLVRDAFVLNPASEINIGAGTKTSENNIILNLNTYFKNTLDFWNNGEWTNLYKLNIFSPQFASDKNFNIFQAYANFGVEYISYYSKRDEAGFIEINAGILYSSGLSRIDSTGITEYVSRMNLNPTLQWNFLGKSANDKIPDVFDEDFYYKCSFRMAYNHYYFFNQDERIINKRSFGNFSIQAGYRFIKSMKLVVEYKVGRMEPKYERINSFSIGIALVK